MANLKLVKPIPIPVPVKSIADLTFEFRKALSAAAGRHIGDDYRAEIMRRFDNRCHVRGDRAKAIKLSANWRAPK